MFLRKKPPQLTLEELQQTYNDCCDQTIKNLALEEDYEFEEALKGWKSLHTTLLYKLDLFEKLAVKLGSEERTILNELRGIRDQNVKHLIRVQLRIDEMKRRKKRENSIAPPAPPVSQPAKTIPPPRSMMKSLRPSSNGSSPRTTRSNQKSVPQASQAATVSWKRPVTAKQQFEVSRSKLNKAKEDLFADFDQNTYSNWEKIDSRTSSNLSEYSDPNLIDLEEDLISKSMDDLTIKPVTETPKKVKPIEHPSKSTSDIPKKPYIYNKPKPMNLQKLMQQNKTQSKPKSNITYNYVKPQQAKKTRPKQNGAKVTPPPKELNSPTMDDLLSGYDDSSANPLSSEKEQDNLIKSIRGIDPIAAKQILNNVIVHGDEVYWDDIVGLEGAKNSLKEAVVYPFLRPDLFKGLREPTRGMLLFGPPGTGKTMLARAVATESQSTFFSISSSSLTSKYLGESEKLVKALFLLARKLAPSIVFMDEIDSLLSSRIEGEVESTRRIKNEFLVQWSELSSAAAGRESNEDVSRVLILGATNLPWSIDEAARRRFVRRQYIPLPEDEARISQIKKLLQYQKNTLTEEDYQKLIELTDEFSGSDITALAKDSAMGPLRSLGDQLLSTPTEQIRPINLEDFHTSLKYIRPSVSKEGLQEYEDWASKYGSSGA